MTWVVVRTRPNAEERARDNLERQGFPTYLPRYRVEQVLRNRVVTLEPVLFPTYLFACIVERWRSVLSTFGVRGLVMSGDGPARLADEDLEALRRRQDPHGFIVLPPRWRVGQELLITAGPLAGLSGLYEGMCGRDRVHLLLSSLLGGGRAEVDERDLAAA